MNKFPIAQLIQEVHQSRAELNAGPFTPLVMLSAEMTLGDALHKLHAHKILSAPIMHRAPHTWAVLDLLDVASATANAAKWGLNVGQLYNLKLADCFNMITLNESVAISLNSTVLQAVNAIVAKDLHRLVIVDPGNDNKPVGIMSQMDVVRFIVKHWDLLPGAFRAAPVSSIMQLNPVTVDHKAKTVAALSLCATKRFSGVGITNDAGSLVGNFSVSDLRNLDATTLPEMLQLSVGDFIARTKKYLVKELITCRPNTPLEEAARLMHQHHVHRLYVKDEADKLVGVLSTTDVCFFVVKSV